MNVLHTRPLKSDGRAVPHLSSDELTRNADIRHSVMQIHRPPKTINDTFKDPTEIDTPDLESKLSPKID